MKNVVVVCLVEIFILISEQHFLNYCKDRTPSSSSFGIWVKVGLHPHHSNILIVLSTGFIPLFPGIHIQLKTQASRQWTPPINLIVFHPCCWNLNLLSSLHMNYWFFQCHIEWNDLRKNSMIKFLDVIKYWFISQLQNPRWVKQPQLLNWHHY